MVREWAVPLFTMLHSELYSCTRTHNLVLTQCGFFCFYFLVFVFNSIITQSVYVLGVRLPENGSFSGWLFLLWFWALLRFAYVFVSWGATPNNEKLLAMFASVSLPLFCRPPSFFHARLFYFFCLFISQENTIQKKTRTRFVLWSAKLNGEENERRIGYVHITYNLWYLFVLYIT